MTSKKKDEGFVDPDVLEAQQEFDRKLLSADASRRQAGRQLAAARKQIELLEEEKDILQAQVDSLLVPAFKKPVWLPSKKDHRSGKNRAVAVFHLSDLHVGEVVDLMEMNGLNKYNPDIFLIRLRYYVERAIHVKRTFMAGVTYDGAVLVLNGDIVSGSIHDELDRTNELTMHESIMHAHEGLRVVIDILLEEFGKVHVVSAPGNHGRHFRKVTYKNFSAENADTAVANWLAKWYESVENVTFDVPRSMDASFELYGYKFSMEHGQAFRFSGTAEIGSIGPITRGTLRKGRQMRGENDEFDYLLLGHFHQWMPMLTSYHGYEANGSLIGYNEFARGNHFPPEPPKQGLIIVTPEFGVSQEVPIFCENRKKEGW